MARFDNNRRGKRPEEAKAEQHKQQQQKQQGKAPNSKNGAKNPKTQPKTGSTNRQTRNRVRNIPPRLKRNTPNLSDLPGVDETKAKKQTEALRAKANKLGQKLANRKAAQAAATKAAAETAAGAGWGALGASAATYGWLGYEGYKAGKEALEQQRKGEIVDANDIQVDEAARDKARNDYMDEVALKGVLTPEQWAEYQRTNNAIYTHPDKDGKAKNKFGEAIVKGAERKSQNIKASLGTAADAEPAKDKYFAYGPDSRYKATQAILRKTRQAILRNEEAVEEGFKMSEARAKEEAKKAPATAKVSPKGGVYYTKGDRSKSKSGTVWADATADKIEAMRNTADFIHSRKGYDSDEFKNLTNEQKDQRAAADVMAWQKGYRPEAQETRVSQKTGTAYKAPAPSATPTTPTKQPVEREYKTLPDGSTGYRPKGGKGVFINPSIHYSDREKAEITKNNGAGYFE